MNTTTLSSAAAAPAPMSVFERLVPVMLLVVKIVNSSKGWYERGAAR